MQNSTIGIDVSKDTLDVHRYPEGDDHRFPNTKPGIKQLVRWLGVQDARIIFEPTGPYHRLLEQSLAKAGRPYVKINPR